jgi:CHAT domain-containing protein/tetratricopeptide (TPR) repeat protein
MDPRQQTPEAVQAITVLAGVARRRRDYRSAVNLMTDAVAIADASPLCVLDDRIQARLNLVSAHITARQFLQARAQLSRVDTQVGELSVENPRLRLVLAMCRARVLASLGQVDEASLVVAEARSIADDVNDDGVSQNEVQLIAADVHRDAGDLAAAALALRDILKFEQSRFWADDPRIAETENKLGLALLDAGDLRQAKKYFRSSLQKREAAYGRDSLMAATVLNNLGVLHGDHGQLAAARRYLAPALRIREGLLAISDPDLIETLGNLAAVAAQQGKTRYASRLLDRAAEGEFLGLASSVGAAHSERRWLTAIRSRYRGIAVALVLAAAATREDETQAVEGILNFKALATGLTSLKRPPRGARQSTVSYLASLLSAMSVRGPRGSDPGDFALRFEGLGAAFVEAEATADLHGAVRDIRYTRLNEIALNIPPNALLIDISIQHIPELLTKGCSDMLQSAVPCYVACVVDQSGVKQIKNLGPAAEIDRLVAGFRTEIEEFWLVPHTASIDALLFKRVTHVCKQLYQRTLALLDESITHRNHVILSLDGDLAKVPFSCLVDETNQFAVERWHFSYLANISGLRSSRWSRTGGVVAFANPAFGSATSLSAEPVDPRAGPQVELPVSSALQMAWPSLDGTVRELEAMKDSLGARVGLKQFDGATATKTNFMSVESPSILHVATHSFFVADERVIEVTDSGEAAKRSTIGFRVVAPDLLRCGIVFEGANLRRNLPDAAPDDGIVTGLEVSTMDLQGTLVFLDTCESGVGDPVAGDSVQGLRLACHLAGAATVVSSLWPVFDADSAALVGSFYRQLFSLEEQSSPSKALHRASLETLQRCRTERHAPHPYYWAPWVTTGL